MHISIAPESRLVLDVFRVDLLTGKATGHSLGSGFVALPDAASAKDMFDSWVPLHGPGGRKVGEVHTVMMFTPAPARKPSPGALLHAADGLAQERPAHSARAPGSWSASSSSSAFLGGREDKEFGYGCAPLPRSLASGPWRTRRARARPDSAAPRPSPRAKSERERVRVDALPPSTGRAHRAIEAKSVPTRSDGRGAAPGRSAAAPLRPGPGGAAEEERAFWGEGLRTKSPSRGGASQSSALSGAGRGARARDEDGGTTLEALIRANRRMAGSVAIRRDRAESAVLATVCARHASPSAPSAPPGRGQRPRRLADSAACCARSGGPAAGSAQPQRGRRGERGRRGWRGGARASDARCKPRAATRGALRPPLSCARGERRASRGTRDDRGRARRTRRGARRASWRRRPGATCTNARGSWRWNAALETLPRPAPRAPRPAPAGSRPRVAGV